MSCWKFKKGVTKEKWFWAYYFLTRGIHFFGGQGWRTFLEGAYHLSQKGSTHASKSQNHKLTTVAIRGLDFPLFISFFFSTQKHSMNNSGVSGFEFYSSNSTKQFQIYAPLSKRKQQQQQKKH